MKKLIILIALFSLKIQAQTFYKSTDSTICKNSQIILKAFGATSYTWNTGGITNYYVTNDTSYFTVNSLYYNMNVKVIGFVGGQYITQFIKVNVKDCTMTGLIELNQSKEIKEIKYFNLIGQEIAIPEYHTIYIRYTFYTDNSVETNKILIP